MTTLTFSQCAAGYDMTLRARKRSPHTVEDYKRTYKKFLDFTGADYPIDEITPRHVESFLAGARSTKGGELSSKSLHNYYVGLSSLWTWCEEEGLVKQNIFEKLKPPSVTQKIIEPFTENDIHAMMRSLSRSKPYTRAGRTLSDHEIPNQERNRAMLLLLLDTGLRASEACALTIADVDVQGGMIKVRHGKGDKERRVPFSPRTGQALWRYLARRKEVRQDDPLLAKRNGDFLSRTELAVAIRFIGQRAGVASCHPHRFRHTFAIFYLRNGGDPYTLQEILGHSSMEMVKKYLRIAQVDLESAHRRASPVDRLRL